MAFWKYAICWIRMNHRATVFRIGTIIRHTTQCVTEEERADMLGYLHFEVLLYMYGMISARNI